MLPSVGRHIDRRQVDPTAPADIERRAWSAPRGSSNVRGTGRRSSLRELSNASSRPKRAVLERVPVAVDEEVQPGARTKLEQLDDLPVSAAIVRKTRQAVRRSAASRSSGHSSAMRREAASRASREPRRTCSQLTVERFRRVPESTRWCTAPKSRSPPSQSGFRRRIGIAGSGSPRAARRAGRRPARRASRTGPPGGGRRPAARRRSRWLVADWRDVSEALKAAMQVLGRGKSVRLGARGVRAARFMLHPARNQAATASASPPTRVLPWPVPRRPRTQRGRQPRGRQATSGRARSLPC